MTTKKLSTEISEQLADLYVRMEVAYDGVAQSYGLSCKGCSDNCCDSYFEHHTYLEWAYLMKGLDTLPDDTRKAVEERAYVYVVESERLLARKERPVLMCPLNENGLCILYSYRLMICRMHGVPSYFMRPDGKEIRFAGCFRCQELIGDKEPKETVDRTELYRELAQLETDLIGYGRHYLPKVEITLAKMIVKGPPSIY